MEIDGAVIGAIGAAASPLIYAVGRAFMADRKSIVDQLQNCEKKHAADQYRLGSQDSAIRFLSSKHSPETQEVVSQMLGEGAAKAEEVTSEVLPKKGQR